jgi:hypothetical protein
MLMEEEDNMSVVPEEAATHICSNCGAKGTETILGNPEGWVEVRIKSGQGIHLDSVICDECRRAVNGALADRRGAVSEPSLQQRVTDAREAGEETIKVTQKGSGRTATVKVSEFDDPKEAIEPTEPAKQKPVVSRRAAVKDMSVAADAAPVSEASGTTGPNATGTEEEAKAE